VGLPGEFRITHLVLGVIAASRTSGVSLKRDASGQSTTTGVPSASMTMSG
jgi:hypothetical protein